MITIVDYGAGNLRSVAKAIEHVGERPYVTASPDDVRAARAIVLPGVGAAADTMRHLRERQLVEPLLEAIGRGVPFLGVCMGLQALMTGSEEGGWQPCLDVIEGTVRRLPAGLTVPHMGWNQVRQVRSHPIFEGIRDGAEFYFVHSYYCDPTDRDVVIGEADYGVAVPAVVARGNLVATQCHPEKSGESGLRLYANFGRLAAVGALVPG